MDFIISLRRNFLVRINKAKSQCINCGKIILLLRTSNRVIKVPLSFTPGVGNTLQRATPIKPMQRGVVITGFILLKTLLP